MVRERGGLEVDSEGERRRKGGREEGRGGMVMP